MTLDSLPILSQSLSSISLSSEETQEKDTFFEKVYSIYYRNTNYNVLNKTIYREGVNVNSLMTILESAPLKPETLEVFDDEKVYKDSVQVIEKHHSQGIVGVITKVYDVTELETWMLNLLLNKSFVVYPYEKSQYSTNYKTYSNLIIDQFISQLKNTTHHDQWEDGGRLFFEKKVDFFTSKGLSIECVLPAFPCKSSNLKKVAGTKPDLGEEMAIRKLCKFSKSVREIYPPGIVVWIVSDGHVFSDCIGVSDYEVNTYGQQLKELYNKVKEDEEFKNESDLIKFASLIDMFNLRRNPVDSSMLEGIEIPHHIRTIIDEESETCRKLLMSSCDSDCGQLRQDIKTPNHPRLSLFRGFSKFMEEDLSDYFQAQGVSRKAMKKTISKVAFEMIKRNDAYSNLVELMFPLHLRFSIHAHTNSGPKFGIQLLSTDTIKVVKSLDECEEPNYDDLLHIPTPWHNSILKYEGDDSYYITKSSVIQEALNSGTHIGHFNEHEGCYFVRRQVFI